MKYAIAIILMALTMSIATVSSTHGMTHHAETPAGLACAVACLTTGLDRDRLPALAAAGTVAAAFAVVFFSLIAPAAAVLFRGKNRDSPPPGLVYVRVTNLRP